MTTTVRMRIGALAAAALGAAVAAAVPAAQQQAAQPRPFTGGTFEASGVAHVPKTNGVLFVDDNRTREIFWMELGPDGAQRAPAAAVPLPLEIEDPEGIAGDGTFFYVVGSQSKGHGPDGAGLARFTFDPKSRGIDRVETITRLKAWLVDQVPELEGIDPARANDDFNIEGLAWDAAGARLLLGFRTPVVDGQALIVPITLRDASGAFAVENLQAEQALRVPLGGVGIRGLDHDPRTKSILIVAEPSSGTGRSRGFSLVEWTPGAADARMVTTFDPAMQPEGVTRLAGAQVSGTVVVFDNSRHTLIR